MRLRGLQLLRIGGIQIVIDYSWFVIFFLVVYLLAVNYFPQADQEFTSLQCWLMSLIAALILFVSVLIHELAHSFVALKYGIRVSSIRLFVFGGVAQVTSEPESGRHEFLIALAGPATSILLAFIFGLVCAVLSINGDLTAGAVVAWYLAWANAILALFNLIPGFPLDGGRILRAILWDRWNDLARATKVVSRIGNAFALFLIIFGALQLLDAQTFIYGLWCIFIGLFMKQAAVGSYQAVAMRQALGGVQIRQIMTESVVAVDWLTSLEELVHNYFYKHQFTNFPVINRDEFIGMVSVSGVKTVPKDLWPFKQVRDIMTPIELVVSLKPTDDATEALARMASNDLGRVPVIDNGHLVGIVSRRDIMNLFKIKSDLGLA